ncbi:hypothetical protein X743_28610 [Mesorhizobium sp. LNHC252B00]|uniref:hypothetical protein n=1 Tax=Mesorhizobium sp. LNHC252B00 TaxID=1287252 RepID=UPI0003CF3613|nr:hypothetical protein [Mesorhizobium sp. LNHC252B00]ESY66388.1 hypothetical protein X743_28610 [Mesorhizobium sp. LNHC252B00]
MFLEAQWADYAQIQATARLSASITQSDANDVRLDRIIDGIALGTVTEAAAVERAVKSHARKQRSRQRARMLTGHAFTPVATASPEQELIWKQAWSGFGDAFSTPELHLLFRSEMPTVSAPMTGAERTRLSRIRSSAAYRAVRVAAFA